MPLLRYFCKVGATLLALLLVADLCLPQSPIAEKTSEDRPAIRIHSDRKWPERVVLDTSTPVVVAAAPETSTAQASAPRHLAEPPVIRAEVPAVANALAIAGGIDAADAEVTAEGDEIVLSGSVGTVDEIERATVVARAVEGVHTVRNRILLADSAVNVRH